MPSNEQVYNAALKRWDGLHVDNAYSRPDAIGKTALLVPFDHTLLSFEIGSGESFTDLTNTCYKLADQLNAYGRSVEPIINATETDFKEVLNSEQITSIIIMGHGCLSSIGVTRSAEHQRLDWTDIAQLTTHLKTGTFTQLTCGTLPREFNVPLGTLTMSDHRRILAPLGRRILTTDISDIHSLPVEAVSSTRRLDYSSIRATLPQRQLTISQEIHVAFGAFVNAMQDRVLKAK